jgi:hypothetical protein
MNPVNNPLLRIALRYILILSSYLRLCVHNFPSLRGFPAKCLSALVVTRMLATCSVYRILLNLIILISARSKNYEARHYAVLFSL